MKATIKLWYGRDDWADREPDVKKKEVECFTDDDIWTDREPPSDHIEGGEVFHEAIDVHNHKHYYIDVEADQPITLYVHTNDSVHTADWSRPIEEGLYHHPDEYVPPFGCELWGEVDMWVMEE